MTSSAVPLVSAIMPAYNAEAYIGKSLQSLLAQDYPSVEIIVVDDGSTDKTVGVVEQFISRVRLVRTEHQGSAAARNTALNVATGDFIAMFDSDDLWPPNRLSLQAAHLLANPTSGCVLGRQEWINPPSWLTRDVVYGDVDGVPLLSAMFRREVLGFLNGFDASYLHSEDMDLLIRARENGIQIDILPDIILYRRFHENQLTAQPPEVSPLLRSLREKLRREREASGRAP